MQHGFVSEKAISIFRSIRHRYYYLVLRDQHKLSNLIANCLIRHLIAQISNKLTEHLVISTFYKRNFYDFTNIVVGFVRIFAQNICGPEG